MKESITHSHTVYKRNEKQSKTYYHNNKNI